jgi:hypothetical protein
VRRLAATLFTVAAIAVAAPAAGLAQSDDCGTSAYCLPAPPATVAAKAVAKKKARAVLRVPVRSAGQIGVAVLNRPARSIARPRRTSAVRVLAVYCTGPCKVASTFDLTIAGETTHPASRTLKLRRSGSGSFRVRLPSGRGRGTLVAHLTVTDDFGTHEATQKLRVG